MAAFYRSGLSSAGVFAGPLAWFVSLQTKYALVPWVCANKAQLIHPVTLASALIGLAGAWLSWRAYVSCGSASQDPQAGGRPHRFLAMLSVLVALLFTLVIVVQGTAAFFLEGCER